MKGTRTTQRSLSTLQRSQYGVGTSQTYLIRGSKLTVYFSTAKAGLEELLAAP